MLNTRKIPAVENAHKFQLLIKSILKNSLNMNPDNEIIYKDKVRYNYKTLNKRVAKYANMLKSIGLNGGAVIGIIDWDSHRYLESYFGITMTANVLHTINWRLSPAQIAYTINHAEDDVIIVNSDFLPLLESIIDDLTTVKKIIIIQENEEEKINTKIEYIGEYEELLAKESDKYDFPDFDEDTLATTFYTTGTTGNPKGVYFSHRQLVMHTLIVTVFQGVCNDLSPISYKDVYLPLTPMFHIHAWGIPFIATMLGLKQIYIGKFDPEVFFETYKKEKPTFTHCVPTIVNMMINHPKAKDIDFNGFKMLVGGSAVPEGLAKQALKRGIHLATGYGMSETGAIVTICRLKENQIKNSDLDTLAHLCTRTGKALPFVDMRVVNDNIDVENNDEEIGEVVLRGPHLVTGYFKNEEMGNELWKDNYLHTGDLATINENQDIMVCDRIKDVIKTGGEWVSSLLLENLIMEHEGVLEVAVVAVPDPKWIERPHALVVLKKGYNLDSNEIKNFLEQYVDSNLINKWAIPEGIDIADEIPKTSVGKINKKLIRQSLTDAKKD